MARDLKKDKNKYLGAGALSNVKDIISRTEIKKIFLITGKASYTSSGAEEYFKSLESTADILIFNDFAKLTLYEDVLKGIKIYRKFNPDLVIAVGGGSVIDMAKSINILAAQKDSPDSIIAGEKNISKSSKDLVAIPTTAGSGSEATHFAVIYKDGLKYSLSSKYILPKFSIIDPELTFSLPKNVAVAGALDALSQSVESFWSNKSTEESKLYAKEALSLILDNIVLAIENKDKLAMENLSLAAHKAGKAINISKTTACHAFSYGLSYHFGVPHGNAVSIFLPSIYMYNSLVDDRSCNDSRGVEYVNSVFKDLNELFGNHNSEDTVTTIKDLLKKFGINNLGDLGVEESRVEFLAKQVNTERLGTNPRLISESDILDLFKSAI